MARIYVSSTFRDLEEYREQVRTALRSMNHDDRAMEYYGASDERPVDKCLRDVEECELYIGIFALRYGFVPPGYDRSITELEYQRARDKNIPCLIFLADEDKWPFGLAEKAALSKIADLRERLALENTIAQFHSPDDLRAKVYQAVRDWEIKTGRMSKEQLTDWIVYRQAVVNRHQWVRLQVIAGASKERGIARIPLTEVFEPQLVAAGASMTDLPEEVRNYQKEIYGSNRQASDETAPVGIDEPEAIETAIEPEVEELLLSANPEFVLDILGRESQQVILGGPGSGKSTILHYAMLRVSEASAGQNTLPTHLQTAPIPLLIELRNYVLQKATDFVSYIVQNAKEYYGMTVEAESLIKVLEQQGQALVFFDGLDEVFDPDERRRVINQFQTFARSYPQAHIVVTSRIAGYDRTALGLAGFEHYTLLPLTLGQIRHFAGQWYQYYSLEGTERTPQGLVQRIVESPRLLDLAGNPLLLTMMAVIYKDRDLPNERWRLYERCADTLLEDWDVSKGIKGKDFNLAVLIRTAQKSEILQRVSIYMLDHGQTGRELNAIAYAPLLDIVASYLEERYQRPRGDAEAVAVDILRHLMERTYVLAGIGEGVFGFVHRTFMEYFAACRCKLQFNNLSSDFTWLTRDIFGAHWQDEAWEEVLLLLIAMLHDQDTQIREVIEYIRKKRKLTVPLNVAFAARCLGEAGDLQDPTQGQALLTELAQAITEHVPQARKVKNSLFVESGLKAFATLAPLVTAPSAVQEAIDRLNQTNTVTARLAAWQMGFALRSRKERLIYALAALQDTEEVVRRGAILALEREWPGRPDIGYALADVVRKDPKARVRQAALSTMQRSWRYEPAILDAIDSRIDQEIGYTWVIRVIEYLAKTWRGNARARDLVIKLTGPKPKARNDYDFASVVKAAGEALAQGWGGNLQALAFLQDRAINALEPEIRAAVVEAIAQGWGGNQQALTFLQELAINGSDIQTRTAVVKAIAQGWGGNALALAFLQERATNDPEPDMRIAVIEAIAQGWSGNDQALTFLQDQANSGSDIQTRAAVIVAIAQGWTGNAQAFTFLQEQAINAPEPEIRIAVVEAFVTQIRLSRYTFDFGGDIQPQVEILRDCLLHDPSRAVRERIIRSFRALMGQYLYSARFKSSDILEILIDRVVNDPEINIKVTALAALNESRWQIGDMMGLQPTKLDINSLVRTREFLEENLAFLRQQSIENVEVDTRSEALWVIAGVGKNNIETLIFLQERATNDPDAQTRLAGIQTIAWHWLNSLRALNFLQERAKNDPEETNRSAIAEVMNDMKKGIRTRYYYGSENKLVVFTTQHL